VHRRGDDNQARVRIEEKKTIADKRCACERKREEKISKKNIVISSFLDFFFFFLVLLHAHL
jgi:hypothetical protein